uniref:Minor tail protein n=1 Tax=Micrococcus phage Olihed TaxID=3092209 RepID=A0AAU6R5Z2_9CAUD
MPLEEPTAPVYGPATFTDLADALATLFSNDEYLKGLIDGIDPTPTVARANLSLAGSYGNNSSYVTTRTVKTGSEVTLECGVITCPASFSGATYYTLGSVASGHRPTDGKHRMGVGAIFSSSAIVPVQYRINGSTGEINFYSQVAVTGASYIILSPINWTVES